MIFHKVQISTNYLKKFYSVSLSFPLLLHGMGTILSVIREITLIKYIMNEFVQNNTYCAAYCHHPFTATTKIIIKTPIKN